jgi:hypothetical protein
MDTLVMLMMVKLPYILGESKWNSWYKFVMPLPPLCDCINGSKPFSLNDH